MTANRTDPAYTVSDGGAVTVGDALVGWVSPWNLDEPGGDWYARRRKQSAWRVRNRHDALQHVLGRCPNGGVDCEHGCQEAAR